MRHLLLVLAAPGLLAACSSGIAGSTGFSFLDPGVRAGQERACAEAAAEARGAAPGAVRTSRTSADPSNGAIVMAYDGGVSGYCRVGGDLRVRQVVF